MIASCSCRSQPHNIVTKNWNGSTPKSTAAALESVLGQYELGHSSISTTLNIYTHVVDASHRKAIEALERELFPSVPKLPDGSKPAHSATRDFRVA
jgi:hypothetical protein